MTCWSPTSTQVRDVLAELARHGIVHGDLSPYNILAAGERLVVIDLPQVVDLVGNPAGPDFLLRDCTNVCTWFRARGLEVDEHDLFGELLAHALLSRSGTARRAEAARTGTGSSRSTIAGRAGPPARRRGALDERWRVSSVDLADRGEQLRACDVTGATFLGCRFAPGDESEVEARGAIVFPAIPDVPVDAYRGSLYSPASSTTPRPTPTRSTPVPTAGRRQHDDQDALLARTLHDHAIDVALADWLASSRQPRGRASWAATRWRRGRAGVRRRGPARRGASARPCVVATGGGPGAMEAANLGAYLSGHAIEALDEAVAGLARGAVVPPVGRRVGRRRLRGARPSSRTAGESLGIPTWHYGHEPPNVFATAIAKYFRNASREAILLQVCDAGIVFLPGAGGTVQEIFQDACENYYADESSVAPMVLVGRRRTGRATVPAWPLLTRPGRAAAPWSPRAPRRHRRGSSSRVSGA